MNKKLEWYIIIFLVIILVGLSGCNNNPHVDKQPPHETKDEMNTMITKEMEEMDREKGKEDNPGPTNFESIAEALGCMFAPDKCVPSKRKAEREMLR